MASQYRVPVLSRQLTTHRVDVMRISDNQADLNRRVSLDVASKLHRLEWNLGTYGRSPDHGLLGKTTEYWPVCGSSRSRYYCNSSFCFAGWVLPIIAYKAKFRFYHKYGSFIYSVLYCKSLAITDNWVTADRALDILLCESGVGSKLINGDNSQAYIVDVLSRLNRCPISF